MKQINTHTCLTEEKLSTIIITLVQEELQKQKQNLLNIIKGNFVIAKKERNELKKELRDFRASLEFTEGELEQKVKNQEEYLDTLEDKVQEIYEYQQDTYDIQDKPVEFEDRSHRNKPQIDGIMEEKEKT